MGRVAVCAALVTLLGAAPAGASVAHTVQPGETLWSIAAASNLTTRSVAAANGLSETSGVQAGRTIWVPSVAEGAQALAGGGAPQATAPAAGGPPASGGPPAPPPMGAYSVKLGDTLSAIAARSGIGASQLAWMNGLDPGAPLLEGTALKLPTGAPDSGEAASPPVSQPVAGAEPVTTPERVTAGQVGQIAAEHGVPASLAAAIAKQESDFNNGLVSSANARGVMQILPGTWSFVENAIAGRDLNPASAEENVRAGVMYLGQLLRDTGGDETTATAAYYQGLSSVRDRGMFDDTRRYVDSVMAQRGTLGGP